MLASTLGTLLLVGVVSVAAWVVVWGVTGLVIGRARGHVARSVLLCVLLGPLGLVVALVIADRPHRSATARLPTFKMPGGKPVTSTGMRRTEPDPWAQEAPPRRNDDDRW